MSISSRHSLCNPLGCDCHFVLNVPRDELLVCSFSSDLQNLAHSSPERSACYATQSGGDNLSRRFFARAALEIFELVARHSIRSDRRPSAARIAPHKSEAETKSPRTPRAFVQFCHRRFIGAGEGIRTLDPDLGKVVLYH